MESAGAARARRRLKGISRPRATLYPCAANENNNHDERHPPPPKSSPAPPPSHRSRPTLPPHPLERLAPSLARLASARLVAVVRSRDRRALRGRRHRPRADAAASSHNPFLAASLLLDRLARVAGARASPAPGWLLRQPARVRRPADRRWAAERRAGGSGGRVASGGRAVVVVVSAAPIRRPRLACGGRLSLRRRRRVRSRNCRLGRARRAALLARAQAPAAVGAGRRRRRRRWRKLLRKETKLETRVCVCNPSAFFLQIR
jgi:hypothetical protein